MSIINQLMGVANNGSGKGLDAQSADFSVDATPAVSVHSGELLGLTLEDGDGGSHHIAVLNEIQVDLAVPIHIEFDHSCSSGDDAIGAGLLSGMT